MQLYVIHCGMTDKDNTLIGRYDPNLNDAGSTYADCVAEELKVISMADVYTSSLTRAFRVGLRIAEYQAGEDCKLITDDILTDMDYGTLTGQPVDNADAIYHKSEPFMRYPKGESYMDIVARIFPFIEQLKKEYGRDSRIAVVTHKPIIRVIDMYCNGAEAMEFMYGRKQYENILNFEL